MSREPFRSAPSTATPELYARLSKSQIFADYREAFRGASGLPLVIRPLKAYETALVEAGDANRFCRMMASERASCAACLDVQQSLEAGNATRDGAVSLRCFAGLVDSSVAVRVDGRPVALLQTGQVLLEAPSAARFSRTARRLLEAGSQLDLGRLEEAYFQTRVLDRERYEAFLGLLSTFAEHLALASENERLDNRSPNPAVRRSLEIISDRHREPLSLTRVAKAVNTSSYYFCRLFKEATGMSFTEYLSRLRVEKAKEQLRDPYRRIGDVAYAVGFRSLSQFNRSFQRHAGCSPSEWRKGRRDPVREVRGSPSRLP